MKSPNISTEFRMKALKCALKKQLESPHSDILLCRYDNQLPYLKYHLSTEQNISEILTACVGYENLLYVVHVCRLLFNFSKIFLYVVHVCRLLFNFSKIFHSLIDLCYISVGSEMPPASGALWGLHVDVLDVITAQTGEVRRTIGQAGNTHVA